MGRVSVPRGSQFLFCCWRGTKREWGIGGDVYLSSSAISNAGIPQGWEEWVWSLPTIAEGGGDAATWVGKRGCDFLPNRIFISPMGVIKDLSPEADDQRGALPNCLSQREWVSQRRQGEGHQLRTSDTETSTVIGVFKRNSSCRTLPGPSAGSQQPLSGPLMTLELEKWRLLLKLRTKGNAGPFFPLSPEFWDDHLRP